MTAVPDRGARWPALGLAVLGLGCLGMAARSTTPLVLINESPSIPRGLYVRTFGEAVSRGDRVALAQPLETRAYLSGLGMPADVRLLKRVAAMPGDAVCRSGDVVRLPDRSVIARAMDGRGTPLAQWRGCRRMEPGEVFLLGDTPGSFDSRYFGPVRVSDLHGVFREVLTW